MDIDLIAKEVAPSSSAQHLYEKDLVNQLYIDQEQIAYIRAQVIEAINQGVPIEYKHSNYHFGDHFIIRSAIQHVLSKFPHDKCTNTPVINLSHCESTGGLNIKDLTRTFGASYEFFEALTNNIYHAYLLWLSTNVGISLNQTDFRMPPVPYLCNFEQTPMQMFDWMEVRRYRRELTKVLNEDLHYNILFHGGSETAKRFSKRQVREIKASLEQRYPRSGFIIITAQDFDNVNRTEDLNDSDADLIINTVENINLAAAAYLFSKNVSLITTDTFGAWLGAGMIASRPDRNGLLKDKDVFVLNTIANPSFWNIAGANHVRSEFLDYLIQEKNRFRFSYDNISRASEYESFNGVNNIAQVDIDRLISRIETKHTTQSPLPQGIFRHRR